jgi:hypothetical protein
MHGAKPQTVDIDGQPVDVHAGRVQFANHGQGFECSFTVA